MRFVMFMIPEVYQPGKKIEEGFTPPADQIEPMMKYNEALAKAGALIALNGLHPASKGARVSFASGRPQVTDGPFTEAKEVIGGLWMIHAKSKEEAIEWAKKVPAQRGDVIEIRQVFEVEEFPEDARKAAESVIVEEHLAKQKKS